MSAIETDMRWEVTPVMRELHMWKRFIRQQASLDHNKSLSSLNTGDGTHNCFMLASLSIYSFVHLEIFIECLLFTDSGVGSKSTAVNKTKRFLLSQGFYPSRMCNKWENVRDKCYADNQSRMMWLRLSGWPLLTGCQERLWDDLEKESSRKGKQLMQKP